MTLDHALCPLLWTVPELSRPTSAHRSDERTAAFQTTGRQAGTSVMRAHTRHSGRRPNQTGIDSRMSFRHLISGLVPPHQRRQGTCRATTLGARMSFATFRDARIVQDVIRRSMRFEVAECSDWRDYQARLLASRGPDFDDSIRRFAGVISSSERCVLCAALAAADYTWLADEIAGGTAYRAMFEDCDRDTRRVVAAAVVRE